MKMKFQQKKKKEQIIVENLFEFFIFDSSQNILYSFPDMYPYFA